ncbi:MAG TPA: hypothetical protein VNF68_06320 [Candidatus Baltobacteraceae bacterium]|nr:hypothetical protein [Candidatus Baltobacteraceae bacterium]
MLAVLLATPTPSPSPSPHVVLTISGSNVLVDQATSGIGQVPPEGAGYAGGQPAAPLSPYDWFSTAPLLPGVTGQIQYAVTGSWHGSKVSFDATALISGIDGDIANGIYWGEPLVGSFDPHEGHSPLPFRFAFPTHAGTNDASMLAIDLPYAASVHANDGTWRVSGGYVQTTQYDGFAFLQPSFVGWTPSLNQQTFESLGSGIADLASWNHFANALPIAGADATAMIGAGTLELTSGVLPGPATNAAHFSGASLVFDRGDAGRFSFDAVHIATSGEPIVIPTLFGSNPALVPGAQGNLALSTLGNQRQTIVGARALVHPARGYDALVELGRAWYDATLVARPGTALPGNYQHYAFVRHFNAHDDAGVEFYRMDPRYGTVLLPYGIAENVWGTAWAYPGPWLKGTYQLVGDAFGGSNREGLRAHVDLKRGNVNASVALYDYRQIAPSTIDNLTQTGFVEVDYLALAPGDAALGHTRGANAYLAWQLPKDTLSIDLANDAQRRDPDGIAPGDFVDMRYPQLVLADEHRFGKGFLASAGYARYHLTGTWTTTPVDGTYGVGFVGAEWDLGRAGQLLVQFRRYGLRGVPSIPGGPPPTFTGTGLVVDQHFQF